MTPIPFIHSYLLVLMVICLMAIGFILLKNRIANLRTITTSCLVIFMVMGGIWRTLVAQDLKNQWLLTLLSTLVTIFGILLVQTMVGEERNKEKFQLLTEQLGKTQKALSTVDQVRSDFISIVGHQLRMPLTTIKWYLASILSGDFGKLNMELKTALLKTQRINNALISLLEDMLNVSRIEHGTMEFFFQEIDLKNLVQTAIEELQPLTEEKKLKVIFLSAHNLPSVQADKEKVKQVIYNLIENAIKYTDEGQITIHLLLEKEEVKFQITDTGKGISEEEMKVIFQKFSRGKESISSHSGLGLGLYVAKIIINQHKGKIWAESLGKNKGATFFFTLPIKNDLSPISLLELTEDLSNSSSPPNQT